MRILVLTFYYKPDLSAGSFRTTALVNELQNIISDHDSVEIISTLPNRYNSFNEEALEVEQIDNILINRIKLGEHKSGFIDQSILFLKFAFKVLQLVRKREKYDVVYATSGRLMTAFLAALISNRQKAKLFLDIRDIFVDTLKSVFKNSKLKIAIPFIKIIEKYTVNSATHINLVSKGFGQYFLSLNPKIPYSFYTNGIDNIFLDFDFQKENESSKKIITYAGNIGEGQGLEKIIPHMAEKLSNDYEIHIVGDGGSKEKLINAVEGMDNVKLFDPVNRTKLLEVYKNSDFLFLHLNDYDAFKKVIPSKLFEYAVTNKHIIAGVGGYAEEFIKENLPDTILFKPCDIEGFMKAFTNFEEEKTIERTEFIEKFNRKSLMNKMAQKVYDL